MKVLDVNEKPKISYCIPTTLRDEQIKINITKVTGRVEPGENKTDPIAVVSFGPSLNETWPELKKFKYIMTCSGAHKFLVEKGIIPTHHMDLDPRAHKVKMLGQPQKGTQYLIASTIHPGYLDALNGYDVKLWHIFATDDEAERILPKGEWKMTGGSSVGLRTITMARFLGFTDVHVFGMDGNTRQSGSHTDFHPNSPPELSQTEYAGKKYITTPSMLFCAQETFKELNQLNDLKATFYGEGLVQAMAKDYKRVPKKGTEIAYNSPELISKEYVELNNKLHMDNPQFGMGGSKYVNVVLELSKKNNTTSILDYGCGKGQLAKGLPFPIWEYDPAIPEKSGIPKPADIVMCTDVLEHIEPDKIEIVLNDLARCTKSIGYFVISTRPAIKKYANGQNTHLLIKDKDWWNKKLSKHFSIGTIIFKEKEQELHAVVAPKKAILPDMAIIQDGEYKYKFLTPNDTTKWRANSIMTKEPITIQWLKSMKPREVLFDVGANVGSYSVIAGVRGVDVYSFEPEAQNYSLLIQNLTLNNIKPSAYCIALSDRSELGMLNLSQNIAGGSCHTFNGDKTPLNQGCIAKTIDEMVAMGLPVPDHIKIDVDGIEPSVILGARHTLDKVKTILVEIDPDSPSHAALIMDLKYAGFEFDQKQVDAATRKDGNFKGYAEYVFYKTESSLSSMIASRINATTKAHFPYPYLYVNSIFPEQFYEKLLKNMPDLYEYKTLEEARGTKGYPDRFVANPTGEFWDKFRKEFLNGKIKTAICERFDLNPDELTEDLILIKDLPGYKIGVHRDRLDKVVSAIFYLPKDLSGLYAGTAIYVPKEEGFTCDIGKHYGFDEFKNNTVLPYQPRSAFIFLNTNKSFHGVEPCDVERNVLLYNLNKKK